MPSSFRGMGFDLRETKMLAWIAATWPGRTLVCQGTDLGHFSGAVGYENFLLAAGLTVPVCLCGQVTYMGCLLLRDS